MELTGEQKAALEEQKKHCPFCKIVTGEIPSQKVYEDEHFVAILDINPGANGHTILIPKSHYPILPFMPKDEQERLGVVVAEISGAVRKAMVALGTDIFVANGAAAGQQTSHFLIHIIPTDKSIVGVPVGAGDEEVKKLLISRFAPKSAPAPDNRQALTDAINSHPDLKQMIINNPNELIANLHGAPDLAALFKGVDIKALSQKLRETESGNESSAKHMSDVALHDFINSKEKLRELLINDTATLEEAIKVQPKLAAFFAGTSIAEVRERYLRGAGYV